MAKTLFVPASDVKPREAGYTIKFNGASAYIRTTHRGIIDVLRVLHQLKGKEAK